MAANQDQVVIDLSNYKSKMSARVPEGRYRCVVADTEATTSGNNNPMVVLWLDIVDGDYAGQTIVDRLTMSEKAMFRVVNFLQAIGLPTPKKKLTVNIVAWRGKVVDVDLHDGEPYNGTVKSEVGGYSRVIKKSSETRTDLPEPSPGAVDDSWAAPAEPVAASAPTPQSSPTAPSGALAEFGVAQPVAVEVPDTVDLDSLDL